ncbi:ketopantoate reductase family protein [Halomonas sp. ML-15]|uniref:ketopantoate reductase family protein n=1 Tax=Halomonas sp. ML-15 TaxID=2773305 RepID=UPI001746BB9D|nr:ketopantoate reductase family protein [Halomonas sp. ML-15]MBD3897499.1 ketopantoate reductase family protein [Halomonas sp. ML-15]
MIQPQLIVGPGALGRLLAMRLSDLAPVTLLGRRPPPESLCLTSPDGQRLQRRLTGATPESLTAPFRGTLHLTTKAYHAAAALEGISAKLAPDTPLVLWQNGYGVQRTLTRRWSGPVLCATTSEGAYVTEGGVVHAGHGETYLGHLDGAHADLAEALAALLSRAGLRCQAVGDIDLRLWHKLVVNAAINPLVARWRIRNGQLRDRPFRPLVEALLDELEAIMHAEGIAPPAEGWHGRVWRVIEGTANNRASMLQDVLAGRPTEHDAILGPLLEAARRHGLATPQLSALYAAG